MKLLPISPIFLLNYLIICVFSQLNSTNDTTTIIILPDSTGTTTTTTTLLPTLITTKPNTITTTTALVIKANTTLTTSTSTTSTPPSTPTTQPTPTTSTPSNGLNLQLKVGLLFANGSKDLRAQFGFGQSAPAITLAMQRAASEQLINNINFNFTWFMCDCDEALASAALITGFISSFYKFPVFVWGAAVAAELNDIPTVTNVNTNTNMLAMGVQALLMQFQWQEISTIYIPDNIGMVCSYFQQDMESLLNNNPNITIVYKKQMDPTTASMKETLNKIKTCSR
uniref:Receptor ligand binding region domain-containing protein n=1 Tax=Meloidogyne javanica TaxID=6303 RepID=A0A915MR85_MELJA